MPNPVSLQEPVERQAPQVERGRFRAKPMVVAACLLVAAIGAQVVIAAVWWVLNLTAIPAYGDTSEYFQLSHSLHVDVYRTILYPAILHVAEGMSSSAIPVQTVVYVVQTAVLIAACGFLMTTLWHVTLLTRAGVHLQALSVRNRRLIIAVATAAVASTPLAVHYAETVLTDSLAASLSVASLAAIIRIALTSRWLPLLTAITVVVAAAAELMRTEKLYLIAGLSAVAVLGMLLRHPRGWAPRLVALLLVLAVPALAVHEVNVKTQTANYGRAPLNLRTLLFNLTVWPRLEQVRPLLPAQLQAIITPQLAHSFDTQPNDQSPMILLLEHAAGGSDVYVDKVTRAALGCCWPAIVATAADNTLKYLAPQVTTAVEWVTQMPATPTPYDLRLMGAAHPHLSAVYLWMSFVLFFLVQLPLALLALLRMRRRPPGVVVATVGLLACAVAGNAVMFALLSAQAANIRYALAPYLVIAAAVTWGAGTVVVRAAQEAKQTSAASANTWR